LWSVDTLRGFTDDMVSIVAPTVDTSGLTVALFIISTSASLAFSSPNIPTVLPLTDDTHTHTHTHAFIK